VNYNHGHNCKGKRSRTYNTWATMKARCACKSSSRYKDYGGRGISVCDRWQTFALFLEDMGERPDGMTLDRIDVNGDYEPSNCKWSTCAIQARNKTTHKRRNIGVRASGKKYIAQIKVNKKTIYLGTHDTEEEAIAVRRLGEIRYWGINNESPLNGESL